MCIKIVLNAEYWSMQFLVISFRHVIEQVDEQNK